ncbi:MAG: hypothetical protein U9N30_00910, partial [Campylobacterota bacterium]|nr:hypothetical protein [Campylobacterota bacterium]
NYVFSAGGLKYQHKLHSIGCDFQNVIKCIDNQLQTNTNFLMEDQNKFYILDTNFGNTLFNASQDYQDYLNYLEDMEEYIQE